LIFFRSSDLLFFRRNCCLCLPNKRIVLHNKSVVGGRGNTTTSEILSAINSSLRRENSTTVLQASSSSACNGMLKAEGWRLDGMRFWHAFDGLLDTFASPWECSWPRTHCFRTCCQYCVFLDTNLKFFPWESPR
jgi:hypothetical protein